jgi:RHS repeat-associated protein
MGINQKCNTLGDLPVAPLSLLGQFYIAPDHLGAPHQITDASGAVAWQWNPDPFGNGDPVGAFAYKLRFPGQFFDQATKLHYNYFRDYDPRTGRYLESDPVGLWGGINTYVYVRNNPVNWLDRRATQVLLPHHHRDMYHRSQARLRRVQLSRVCQPTDTTGELVLT